jgi:D-serine deaminase-like pyridoxal phosphate-dependent protein
MKVTNVESIPRPAIAIDAQVVLRNLARMAEYAKSHALNVRPHTKTHKSAMLARMQLDHGAAGLTVAKAGEAQVMSAVRPDVDLLLAYPVVDQHRCQMLAALAAEGQTIRIAIDSTIAADALGLAASSAGATIGILVDLDVGLHRTGVQSPQASLALAQHVTRQRGLRLDGIMIYPGHIWSRPSDQVPALRAVDAIVCEAVSLWQKHGLAAPIVSGGSTPTALQSHHITHLTEIRPGTYVFNDMNSVAGGFCTLEDCAARVISTVVSDAAPGQVVIDAGSKTLSSDRRHDDPDAGHGYIVEFPQAKIAKLSEEHAQVDVRSCDRAPKVGQRLTVIPNHICPCINLQDQVYWLEPDQPPREIRINARGCVV